MTGFIRTKFFTAALTACMIFTACSHSENTTQKENAASVYKKPPCGFADTLIINESAAVFFTADSVQLKKIKAISEKMFFESSCHDCFYQMRNARKTLKQFWPEIKMTNVTACRYLLFEKKDNSKTVIDLDSNNDMCGIFLFNTVKEPLLIDMMNIDTELNFYFRQ